MICTRCTLVATTNRKLFDIGKKPPGGWIEHPQCGCACMHEEPRQWEKLYSVGRPDEETSNHQD